jgi:NSS family neurotransmitter:Na+ symporter
MGQSFFSLSLGVGTMLIYGSYLGQTLAREQQHKKQYRDKLPKLGVIVTLLDSGFSFLAGLIIVPALYIAQQQGVEVFDNAGKLIAGPGIVLQVLPSLFSSMGDIGVWVSLCVFTLLAIAAITSSVSMLEVPVSVICEKTKATRAQASYYAASGVFIMSCCILYHFSWLFDWVIIISTRYSEPLMGMVMCLFAGWLLHRDKKLMQLRNEQGLSINWFWRIWPWYVRIVCPFFIGLLLLKSIF